MNFESIDKDNNGLVSIVIPVYNGENTIGRAIESVLSQDYDNIELIIVDDGSTDRTANICNSYKKSNKRIELYLQEHLGASCARNKGIDLAKGDFIAFLDADDELLPNFVSRNIELYLETKAEFIIVNAFFVYKNKCEEAKHFSPPSMLIDNNHDKEVLIRQVYNKNLDFYVGECNKATWAKFYKTKTIKENDIRFPNDVSIGEDAIFVFQMVLCANKIYFRDEYLYKYIKNGRSVTRSFIEDYYANRKRGFLALIEAKNKFNCKIDDLEKGFWRQAYLGAISNVLYSNYGHFMRIRYIHEFLNQSYCLEYLEFSSEGIVNGARRIFINKRLFLLLSVVEYFGRILKKRLKEIESSL